MGRPEQRTVVLSGGPADGRSVKTAYDWVFVSIQDGDRLVQFDSDTSNPREMLGQVRHSEDWVEYVLHIRGDDGVPGQPDIFIYGDDLPRPAASKWFAVDAP